MMTMMVTRRAYHHHLTLITDEKTTSRPIQWSGEMEKEMREKDEPLVAGGRLRPKKKLEKRRNDSTREESDAFSLGCDRFRAQDDGPGRAA